MHPRSLSLGAALGVALLVAPAADAQTLSAVDGQDLLTIDLATGQTSIVGPIALSTPVEFQMGAAARFAAGALYGISSSSSISRVYLVDEATAATTEVAQIQSGPIAPRGAAVEPGTGRLFFIDTFGFVPAPSLRWIDPATGAEGYAGAIDGSLQAGFFGLAFDPTGRLYSVDALSNRLYAVDPTQADGPGTQPIGAGLGAGVDLSKGGALEFDAVTGSLLLYEGRTGSFFTVDPTTGAATAIPTAQGLGANVLGFAIAEDTCPGDLMPYGQGCPGSNGLVPSYSWSGCPVAGGSLSASISNALGGSTALVLFGTGPGTVPVGAGCSVLVAPLSPLVLALPLGGSGPGAGSLTFAGSVPPTTFPVRVHTQVFVLDPASPIGASASAAIQITIP